MIGLFERDGDHRRTRLIRTTQIFEAALLLIGTVCIGWFGYNWLASQADQLWSDYSLDERLTGHEASVTGFLRHVINGGAERTAVRTAESRKATRDNAEAQKQRTDESPQWPARLPSGEDIGRIEIPRLGISSIVRQGVDDKTLSRAVGHVPYTALPGQKGNIGIAAHRDTYFRNLRGVREGDLIRLVTTNGTFEYRVEALRIVLPTNVEVLNPTPNPSLTLVTCYPFNFVGHAPKRFIVRARQIQTAVPETRRS